MDTEIRGHEITAGPGAHGEQPRAPFVPRGLLADTMPPASLPQSPHRNPGARPPVGVGVGCALLENVLLPRGYPTPSSPRRAAAPRVTGARISSPVSIFRVTGASCHPVPRLRDCLAWGTASSDLDPGSSWLDSSLLPAFQGRGRRKISLPPTLWKCPLTTESLHTSEGHAEMFRHVRQTSKSNFMMPESLLSHQSSDFYGVHLSGREEGGERGAISRAVVKGEHRDPNRKCNGVKAIAALGRDRGEENRARPLAGTLSPSRRQTAGPGPLGLPPAPRLSLGFPRGQDRGEPEHRSPRDAAWSGPRPPAEAGGDGDLRGVRRGDAC